jgi:hypothetical protein
VYAHKYRIGLKRTAGTFDLKNGWSNFVPKDQLSICTLSFYGKPRTYRTPLVNFHLSSMPVLNKINSCQFSKADLAPFEASQLTLSCNVFPWGSQA